MDKQGQEISKVCWGDAGNGIEKAFIMAFVCTLTDLLKKTQMHSRMMFAINLPATIKTQRRGIIDFHTGLDI